MKECEGRFMLAREAARRTWPDEWWQSDELLPLLRKPFTDIVNDAHEGGSSTTVQLPVGRYPLPHLNRLYGDTCMQEAVVPRQLHGRTLSHPLYIPMELF
uniref:Uncharacterized protein TCIL3000_5_1220 n=1 Tax=Trypanosoma congolense (strain IL3000) TaxID=1068625 RepID=G0UML4_TRYCI|nr:unnamed protein product [Trypanosoma congolense IL3000]